MEGKDAKETKVKIRINKVVVVLELPIPGQDSGLVWADEGPAKFVANLKFPKRGLKIEKGRKMMVRFLPESEELMVSEVLFLLAFEKMDEEGRVLRETFLVGPPQNECFYWDKCYRWIRIDEVLSEQLKKCGSNVIIRYENSSVNGFNYFWRAIGLKMVIKVDMGVLPEFEKFKYLRRVDENENFTPANSSNSNWPTFSTYETKLDQSLAPKKKTVKWSRPESSESFAPRAAKPKKYEKSEVSPSSSPHRSVALVTGRTQKTMTLFLHSNSQAAICDWKNVSGPSLKVGAHFNCYFQELSEPVEGIRFEVTRVTKRVAAINFISKMTTKILTHDGFRVPYHEAQVLIKIDFSKIHSQFSKLVSPNWVIRAKGIAPYVMLGEKVLNEKDKLVPAIDLFKKYRDRALAKLIGWCTFELHRVPRAMVNSMYFGKETMEAYVWKLERIVGHEEELEWLEQQAAMKNMKEVDIVDKLVEEMKKLTLDE